MPQSFGPFEYKEEKYKMLSMIEQDLSQADLIFAREKEGFDLLKNQFSVKRLRLSPDLVLQCDEIDWNNIYYVVPKLKYPILQTTGNVAIIPNMETFRLGDETCILEVYQRIIQELIFTGKQVYIFRHSRDLQACEKIYVLFSEEKSVHLIKEDLECSEYSQFIQQFDYIIASRYHAIVHAYKERVPAIILGWAIKYQELAGLFGQQEYVFDITQDNVDCSRIIRYVKQMNAVYHEESCKIGAVLAELQHENCVDVCWNLLCGKRERFIEN